MNEENYLDVLKSLPLFQGLTRENLQIIAQGLQEKTFSAGKRLIEQEGEPSFAYILISGSVRVYRTNEEGQEINIAILGPHEVVGEMSLVDNEPRSATVEALQETKTLALNKADFLKILSAHPELALNLLRLFSARVRATNEYLEEVFSKKLAERTWKTLLTLAKYFPNNDITLSQEELAEVLGATRSRVTEVLNELEKTGKINTSHRNIHLN